LRVIGGSPLIDSDGSGIHIYQQYKLESSVTGGCSRYPVGLYQVLLYFRASQIKSDIRTNMFTIENNYLKLNQNYD
jgi:hypothetical protein